MKFRLENLCCFHDTGQSGNRGRVKEGAAGKNEVRTESERFHDIGTTSKFTVDHYCPPTRSTIAGSAARGYGTIELPSAVVRDDHSVGAYRRRRNLVWFNRCQLQKPK